MRRALGFLGTLLFSICLVSSQFQQQFVPYYPVRYDYMQIPRFRRGIGDETFFADPEAFGVPKHSFNDVQTETVERTMEELNTGDQFPSDLRFFDDADIAAAEAEELAAQEAMSVGSNVAVRFTDETVEDQQNNSSMGEPENHESTTEESGQVNIQPSDSLHSNPIDVETLHSSSPMNSILASEAFHSMSTDREFTNQNLHITEPVNSDFVSESFNDGPMFIELIGENFQNPMTGEMGPGFDFSRMDNDPLGEGFVVIEMNDEFGERFDDAVARTLVKRQAQVRQPRPFRPVPARNQVVRQVTLPPPSARPNAGPALVQPTLPLRSPQPPAATAAPVARPMASPGNSRFPTPSAAPMSANPQTAPPAPTNPAPAPVNASQQPSTGTPGTPRPLPPQNAQFQATGAPRVPPPSSQTSSVPQPSNASPGTPKSPTPGATATAGVPQAQTATGAPRPPTSSLPAVPVPQPSVPGASKSPNQVPVAGSASSSGVPSQSAGATPPTSVPQQSTVSGPARTPVQASAGVPQSSAGSGPSRPAATASNPNSVPVQQPPTNVPVASRPSNQPPGMQMPSTVPGATRFPGQVPLTGSATVSPSAPQMTVPGASRSPAQAPPASGAQLPSTAAENSKSPAQTVPEVDRTASQAPSAGFNAPRPGIPQPSSASRPPGQVPVPAVPRPADAGSRPPAPEPLPASSRPAAPQFPSTPNGSRIPVPAVPQATPDASRPPSRVPSNPAIPQGSVVPQPPQAQPSAPVKAPFPAGPPPSGSQPPAPPTSGGPQPPAAPQGAQRVPSTAPVVPVRPNSAPGAPRFPQTGPQPVPQGRPVFANSSVSRVSVNTSTEGDKSSLNIPRDSQPVDSQDGELSKNVQGVPVAPVPTSPASQPMKPTAFAAPTNNPNAPNRSPASQTANPASVPVGALPNSAPTSQSAQLPQQPQSASATRPASSPNPARLPAAPGQTQPVRTPVPGQAQSPSPQNVQPVQAPQFQPSASSAQAPQQQIPVSSFPRAPVPPRQQFESSDFVQSSRPSVSPQGQNLNRQSLQAPQQVQQPQQFMSSQQVPQQFQQAPQQVQQQQFLSPQQIPQQFQQTPQQVQQPQQQFLSPQQVPQQFQQTPQQVQQQQFLSQQIPQQFQQQVPFTPPASPMARSMRKRSPDDTYPSPEAYQEYVVNRYANQYKEEYPTYPPPLQLNN